MSQPAPDPASLLGALVDALATAVAAKLEPARGADSERYYDASSNPLGSPRAFLDAGRRGDFPTYRAGKRVLALRADVHAWIEARPTRRRQESAPGAEVTDEELLAQAGVRLAPTPASQVEHQSASRRRSKSTKE